MSDVIFGPFSDVLDEPTWGVYEILHVIRWFQSTNFSLST